MFDEFRGLFFFLVPDLWSWSLQFEYVGLRH